MMNFEEVADSLYSIATMSSNLGKEDLLRKFGSEVTGFKEILRYIYDPYFTTGIGQKKLDAGYMSNRSALPLGNVMEYLKSHCTGTEDAVTVALDFIYSNERKVWQWAAQGLVTKDLQIGVSVTTLKKIFGNDFIPTIGIMRGMLCPDDAKGLYIATEKIDGNRRIIMNKSTGVEIYTRSGKRDRGLVEIEEQASQLPVDYVYDTECIAVGDWADSIECRQASASILNSGGIRTGVKALCFDMLTQHEYDHGTSSTIALLRKAKLAMTLRDYQSVEYLLNWVAAYPTLHASMETHLEKCIPLALPLIKALPILGIVTNKQEGIELAKPIWETGGEGVMLVNLLSQYEVNPNPRKTLLKIKATKEFTLKCTNVCEGDNKYAGMLGAIEVEYQRRGDPAVYTVKVGSGFPDYLRKDYWNNPYKIIGKQVEIESFGESRNAQGGYSLNCPIFKRVVGTKE